MFKIKKLLCSISLVCLVFFIINSYAQKPIKKILLVVAMQTEAEPIISKLNLKLSPHSFSGLPMRAYMGKYKNLNILLILNGEDPISKVPNIGTQAATLTTYLGAEYFHPDLIISIGTAGGVGEKGAEVGDIYISHKNYFYARRMPYPGYAEYGLGAYPSINLDAIRKHVQHTKQGDVCSGDSFDEDPLDFHASLKNGCSAIEMEGAAVAWVSMLMKIPFVSVKGITDIENRADAHDEFDKNFSAISNSLAEKLQEILTQLSLQNAKLLS